MAKLTSHAQRSGYRFLAKRLQHALYYGDGRMLHDPLRAQSRSMVVGSVIALVVCVVMFVLSTVLPAPTGVGDKFIMGQKTGVIYVQTHDGIYHPIMNLPSAQLIVGGKNPMPKIVSEQSLVSMHIGSLLGIVSAPTAIRSPSSGENQWWTLCDHTSVASMDNLTVNHKPQTTEIIASSMPAGAAEELRSEQAILVADEAREIFLLYGNKRHKVDIQDAALLAFLRKDNVSLQTRYISYALLNSIPEGNPIRVPAIDHRGKRIVIAGSEAKVGDILSVKDIAGRASYYVVLYSGIQQVSLFSAQLIQLASTLSGKIVDLDAISHPQAFISFTPQQIAIIARAPETQRLPVDDYPQIFPTLLANTIADTQVLCFTWEKNNMSNAARMYLSIGSRLPMAVGQNILPVFSAPADTQRIAAVALSPLTGHYVVSSDLREESEREDFPFYIDDLGCKYGIPQEEDAQALGLAHPQKVPWQFLASLPNGPELTRERALREHQGAAMVVR